MPDNTRKFEITGWNAESPELYREGGFHPTHLGDVLKEHYKIIRKLGSASYSTVWLARDMEKSQYVSIKIGSAADGRGTALARPVVAAHNTIAASSHPGKAHVVPLLDYFEHKGPNGEHPCLVFKPLGRNMAAFMEQSQATVTPTFARELCRQLMLALDCIHSAGFAHRDIHPGNVLLGLNYNIDAKDEEEINRDINLQIPPEDEDEDEDEDYDESESEDEEFPFVISRVKRIDGGPLTEHEPRYLYEPCPLSDETRIDGLGFSFYLCDLGAVTSSPKSTQTSSTRYPGALGFRSPQVVLGNNSFSYQAADIWALGLTIWEVIMRNRLLTVDDLGSPELTDDSHLESIVNRLGPMPATLRALWPRADKWVDQEGNPLHPYGWPEIRSAEYDAYWHGGLHEALRNRKDTSLQNCLWTDADIDLFEAFLQEMLAWEEKDRATTKELLNHGWLKAEYK